MVLPLLSALPPTLLLVAGTPSPLCHGEVGEIRLDLTVVDITSNRGGLMVVVYDNPDTFLQRGRRLFKARVPAAAGSVDVCVRLPRSGTYAVAVYHDADNDGKFGRNWIGLPTEGWGFTNNPPRALGIPTFGEVAFSAGPEGGHRTIHLNYP